MPPLEYCSDHVNMATDIAVIKDKVMSMSSSKGAILGIIFTIIVQVVTFGVLWGQLITKVQVQGVKIVELEALHPRIEGHIKGSAYAEKSNLRPD